MDIDNDNKEKNLQNRLEHIKALEEEIKQREKALKSKEQAKKQVLLRLAPTLWEEVAAWAEEDFRSINGQIEFILREAIRGRKKSKKLD